MTDLTNIDVTNLVKAACKNDNEAFNQLVDIFHKPLVGFILAKIHGNMDKAEEIAQQVWEEVCKKIRKPAEEGGYDPAKGSFYAYITKCFAEYKIRQCLSNKNVHFGMPIKPGNENENDETAEPHGKEEHRPEKILEIKEELQLLFDAYLEAFRLTFLCGGYPHQQFAFAYSKLIYGDKSNRGIEGEPEKVDQRHGNIPFERLTCEFWEVYKSTLSFNKKTLNYLYRYLGPLQQRILYKVEKRIRGILGLEKGTSNNKVMEEIGQRLHEGRVKPSGCGRCKLHHVLPCKIIKLI